ncbi:MAG TPA: hypothetical protein VNU97_11450 [Rhizomicrobium sp.]|jgi:hypothetical protein|nr:hypothetical protein [Rhizomicrobium sp.]
MMSATLSPRAAFAVSTAVSEVSLLRLYALRATYLLLVVGMGFQIWPAIVHHAKPWDLMHGVASCMLGAMSALAILGLRYPLRMLPILFFELVWKSTWLIAIAYPLWAAHRIDADTAETVQACLMGVIFPLVIPWPYVFANYLKAAGDRWR